MSMLVRVAPAKLPRISITFDRRMNRQQQQAHGVVVTKFFRSRNELAVAEIS
jgi:hypothetical protein